MEDLDDKKEEREDITAIAEEIVRMKEADQEMRKRVEKNQGVIETEEDESLDIKNTERMKQIVEQIGWPTISKVGEEVSTAAWLLVQHADHDVPFQKYCLDLMKAQPDGEVALHDIAYLEDRIRVNTNQPQLYGTQFRWEGSGPIQNIEDRENVDERRKAMELVTLAENTEEMYRTYNIPRPASED